MSVNTGEPSAPRSWQRRVIVVLALLAALHSVVLVFWLAPQGPVRNAVGDRALTSYVNPYFDQAWSGLAPNAQFVDETFQVRARIVDEGTKKESVSPWLDLTAAEDDALRHSLDPARVHVMARKVATNLNGAMYGLTAAQRRVARSAGLSTSTATLTEQLLDAGDRPAAVATFMTYDQMASRFASMYVKAVHGDTVMAVQYRVGRRTVPAFGARAEETVRDREFRWFTFGPRRGFDAPYEAQLAFDEYVGK